MTQKNPKKRIRGNNRAARELKLPPRDYQPSKAEREQEYDMPGADMKTVRSAFFRPVKARETNKDG